MNIDLVKFAEWYKNRVDNNHLVYNTISFDDKDDWYCSHKNILALIISELEDYNMDTLAESA